MYRWLDISVEVVHHNSTATETNARLPVPPARFEVRDRSGKPVFDLVEVGSQRQEVVGVVDALEVGLGLENSYSLSKVAL